MRQKYELIEEIYFFFPLSICYNIYAIFYHKKVTKIKSLILRKKKFYFSHFFQNILLLF